MSIKWFDTQSKVGSKHFGTMWLNYLKPEPWPKNEKSTEQLLTCGSFSSSSMGALTDAVSMDLTLDVSQVAAVGLGTPDLGTRTKDIIRG